MSVILNSLGAAASTEIGCCWAFWVGAITGGEEKEEADDTDFSGTCEEEEDTDDTDFSGTCEEEEDTVDTDFNDTCEDEVVKALERPAKAAATNASPLKYMAQTTHRGRRKVLLFCLLWSRSYRLC